MLARAETVGSPEAAWMAPLRRLVEGRRQAGGGSGQVALFEQYTAVLQRLARQRPLLLVLEDLHWLTPAR